MYEKKYMPQCKRCSDTYQQEKKYFLLYSQWYLFWIHIRRHFTTHEQFWGCRSFCSPLSLCLLKPRSSLWWRKWQSLKIRKQQRRSPLYQSNIKMVLPRGNRLCFEKKISFWIWEECEKYFSVWNQFYFCIWKSASIYFEPLAFENRKFEWYTFFQICLLHVFRNVYLYFTQRKALKYFPWKQFVVLHLFLITQLREDFSVTRKNDCIFWVSETDFTFWIEKISRLSCFEIFIWELKFISIIL